MKSRHIGILVTGILMLATAQASATDSKQYPGAVCRQEYGGVFGYYDGSVANGGTDAMRLMCPLVRDATNINSAIVNVYDRNGDTDFECELNGETTYAGWFSGTTLVTSTDTENGGGFYQSNFTTLHFGSIGTNDYYYLECTVPEVWNGNYSHLGSISVTEN